MTANGGNTAMNESDALVAALARINADLNRAFARLGIPRPPYVPLLDEPAPDQNENPDNLTMTPDGAL